MAAGDPALVAVAHRRPRDRRKGRAGGVARFVDVEVDIEVALAGEDEEAVEQVLEVGEPVPVQARRGPRHAADEAAAPSGHDVGERRRVGGAVDVERHQGHALQGDAAREGTRISPSTAQLSGAWPRRNRGGCGWPTRRGPRRSAGRRPCDGAGPGAANAPRGPPPTASRAPAKSPRGFGARSTMWPLSRWVWTSTSVGHKCRPARSTSPGRRGRAAAGRSPRRGRPPAPRRPGRRRRGPSRPPRAAGQEGQGHAGAAERERGQARCRGRPRYASTSRAPRVPMVRSDGATAPPALKCGKARGPCAAGHRPAPAALPSALVAACRAFRADEARHDADHGVERPRGTVDQRHGLVDGAALEPARRRGAPGGCRPRPRSRT